jgi:hypothetical protein
MTSSRIKARKANAEDRKQAPISKQQSSLWRSVMNFIKTVPRALGLSSKSPAKSVSGRAEKSASRLTDPQSKGGRRPGRIGDRAAKQTPAKKFKTSPNQQQGDKNRSSSAPSSKYPNLQGPRLIDRVLKDISGTSRKPPAVGGRTSRLSRNSAKGNRRPRNSVPSGKRGGSPRSRESKAGPNAFSKKGAAQSFTARNRRVQKRDGSQSKQRIGTSRGPGKQPQQQNEGSSFWKFLQQSVSRFFPPARPMMDFAASLIPGGKGQRDSFGNNSQRSDQGRSLPVQDATSASSESTDGETGSDDQQFDEPAANGQSGGWPTSTHSISDARFNNVPKRPLKPIR